ncbi:MAG: amidohydrolase family protein, partial [Desulfovibrionales bacterium]|nr:amidohydrolase family protein [Desulfovibrionales bacterium]
MHSKVKKSIGICAVLALLIALAAFFGASAQAAKAQTQVYYNGDIQTVDAKMTEVEALAVKDGKILATGSLKNVEAAAGAEAVKFDLEGNTLLPGFYDAHSHFLSTAVAYSTQVMLPAPPAGNIKSIDDLVAALAERAKQTKPGDWV